MARYKIVLRLLVGVALLVALFSHPFMAWGQMSWKRWEKGESIQATLVPSEAHVKPDEVIVFKVSGIEDKDYYTAYGQDERDESKLPTKMATGKEDDICTLEWHQKGGAFETAGHRLAMEWRAPNEVGAYEVGVVIDDLALMRAPDRGERDDEALRLVATVTVSGTAGLTLWLSIVSGLVFLTAFIVWLIVHRLKRPSKERA